MPYTDNFADTLTGLVSNLTAADKMNINELLYARGFTNTDLADSHTVVPGVRDGHVVPIVDSQPDVDSFPFVDETDCEPNECDVSTDWSSSRWELGLLECRVGICMRKFNEDFLLFFNQWRQTQQGEINTNSAILDFIYDKFVANLQIAEWRAAYFADKSSDSPLYNRIDGFFAQAEAYGNVVDITENDGATFAEQAIEGEAVYNYLIDMYERASDFAWFDPATMEYRVTRSMASRLVRWLNQLGLKAPSNCACIDPNTAVARPAFGFEGLTINGIPVRVHGELDMIINRSAELNGGGGDAPRVNPNRAILTFRDNMLIGTSQTNALQSFDIWYSKDDKKVYMEGSSYLGASIPQDYYVAAL